MAADYYAILGIKSTASREQIKQAYYKKARELHPDRHGDDKDATAQFQLVRQAYVTLSDTKLRREYDHTNARIDSIKCLFERSAAGKLVMDMMLPKAPAAPVRGLDLALVVSVRFDLLKTGGRIQIPGNATQPAAAIQMPPDSLGFFKCVLAYHGLPGTNAGRTGDLHVFINAQPSEEGK